MFHPDKYENLFLPSEITNLMHYYMSRKRIAVLNKANWIKFHYFINTKKFLWMIN